jgi:uncharacterized protein (DUF2126 family)
MQLPAAMLGLDPEFIVTAYEDAPKLLQEEAALPANLDPMQIDLTKPDERARLARQLLQGAGKVSGYVLPLRPVEGHARKAGGDRVSASWESSPWPLRRERLYLVAGDSPLGLRLPLNSLPCPAGRRRIRAHRTRSTSAATLSADVWRRRRWEEPGGRTARLNQDRVARRCATAACSSSRAAEAARDCLCVAPGQ